MPAILAESDAFVDLTDPELDGRWLDFKAEGGTNSDGQMIGYATDAGPEGICYRADLFEKAGLPTDRAEVAALMTTWDDYFALGEQFIAKVPDTAWYDSTGGIAQAMLNQVEYPFEEADGTVNVENAELQALYATITGNIEKGLSTTNAQWSDDWTAAFQHDGFATMPCPGWMLGVVGATPRASRAGTWPTSSRVAAATGAARTSSCPKQSEHPDEAKEFAAWITAPEQQLKAFEAKGTFPSQVDALDDPGAARRRQRVLQRRPDRRDPVEPGQGDRGPAVQGSEVLRHPAGVPERPAAGGRRLQHSRGVVGDLPVRRRVPVLTGHPRPDESGRRRALREAPPPRCPRGAVASAMRVAGEPAPHPAPAAVAVGRAALAVPLHLAVLHAVPDRGHVPALSTRPTSRCSTGGCSRGKGEFVGLDNYRDASSRTRRSSRRWSTRSASSCSPPARRS